MKKNRDSIYLFLLLIGFMSSCLSCYDSSQPVIDNNCVNVTIDSVRHIFLEHYDENYSFIVFNRKDKNVFWHFNRYNFLEKIIIGQNGDSIQPVILPSRLTGKVFKEYDVILDPTEPGTIWINGLNGVCKLKDGIFSETLIPKCSRIYVFKNWIIASSEDHGLMIYNKTMTSLDTFNNSGFQFYDVQESQAFGLIIGGKRYIPPQKEFEKISSINGVNLSEGGLNYLFESDSFNFYRPGRYANSYRMILGNREYKIPGAINGNDFKFENPVLWIWGDRQITSYNTGKFESNTINVQLPIKSVQQILLSDTLFWVIGSDRLYSIDKLLSNVYSYPIRKGNGWNVKALSDNSYLYVLCDKNFSIYNKKYLLGKREIFYYNWRLTEIERYKHFIYSLSLDTITSFKVFYENIQEIDSNFSELLKIDDTYETNKHKDFQGNLYWPKFREGFLDYVLHNNIYDKWILGNIPYTLSLLVDSQQLKRVFFLDSIFKKKYGALFYTKNLYWDSNKYEKGLNNLRHFSHNLDSLKKNAVTEDEYKFKEAIQYLDLCQIGWYGDNECDNSVGYNLLQKFISEWPASAYRDEGRYVLLTLGTGYSEDGELYSGAEDAYIKFIYSFPNPDVLYKSLEDMIQIYIYKYGMSEVKNKFKKLTDDLLIKYPEKLDVDKLNQIIKNWK